MGRACFEEGGGVEGALGCRVALEAPFEKGVPIQLAKYVQKLDPIHQGLLLASIFLLGARVRPCVGAGAGAVRRTRKASAAGGQARRRARPQHAGVLQAAAGNGLPRQLCASSAGLCCEGSAARQAPLPRAFAFASLMSFLMTLGAFRMARMSLLFQPCTLHPEPHPHFGARVSAS